MVEYLTLAAIFVGSAVMLCGAVAASFWVCTELLRRAYPEVWGDLLRAAFKIRKERLKEPRDA